VFDCPNIAIASKTLFGALGSVNVRLNRSELEKLRDAKCSRNFYRLESSTYVEHEFRHPHFGHPSTYAFVRFACDAADDLSFEARALWPSTVRVDYCLELLTRQWKIVIRHKEATGS
jgi:hypothetical protein